MKQLCRLNEADIDAAVDFVRKNPNRAWTYNIPIPFYENPIHIGAAVKVPKGNRYVIVDFRDEFAICVPINPPHSPSVCAYPILVSELTPCNFVGED